MVAEPRSAVVECLVGLLVPAFHAPREKMMRRFPGELMFILAASSVTVT
jgi:hypothetical protein